MKNETKSRVTAKKPAHEGLYEVVYPLGRLTAKNLHLAQNIPDLSGKTICGAGNRFFGEEVAAAVAELLQQQYPGLKFIPNTELPALIESKEEMEKFKEILRHKGCDAVISATGA